VVGGLEQQKEKKTQHKNKKKLPHITFYKQHKLGGVDEK